MVTACFPDIQAGTDHENGTQDSPSQSATDPDQPLTLRVFSLPPLLPSAHSIVSWDAAMVAEAVTGARTVTGREAHRNALRRAERCWAGTKALKAYQGWHTTS